MTVPGRVVGDDALRQVAGLGLLRARLGPDDAGVEAARRSRRLVLALQRVGEVARLDLVAGGVPDPLAEGEHVRLPAVGGLGDRLRQVGHEVGALGSGHLLPAEQAVAGHAQHLPVLVVRDGGVDRLPGSVPEHRQRAAAMIALGGLRRGAAGVVPVAVGAAAAGGARREHQARSGDQQALLHGDLPGSGRGVGSSARAIASTRRSRSARERFRCCCRERPIHGPGLRAPGSPRSAASSAHRSGLSVRWLRAAHESSSCCRRRRSPCCANAAAERCGASALSPTLASCRAAPFASS